VDEKRVERLQIMLAAEEFKALDDWRFSRRMPSRAASVRELLKRGLAAEGFLLTESDAKSSDFGVTAGASKPAKPSPPSPDVRSKTRSA
jgi:hypothetical protein